MGMSPVRRAFVILAVAAVVVAIFLVLAQDNFTLKVRSAAAAGDAGHPTYIAALVGADATRGNDYDVLTNGDQIFPAMLEAIRGAKRRISFETYIYETGKIADQFTAAFEEAARRGVRSTSSSTRSASSIDGRGARGAPDGRRLPDRRASTRRAGTRSRKLNYRTHRKILVVDGEVGFTGGVGIADHWLGNAQDTEHWRDTQVRDDAARSRACWRRRSTRTSSRRPAR